MFEQLQGLSESQRRTELMAGVWLTPGQQLAHAAFGGMDEVHEGLADDGRDLAGVAKPSGRVRKGPNSVERTLRRWSGNPALTFVSGPTHVEPNEEADLLTPEAVLIAAEEGNLESVLCAIGTDSMVTAWDNAGPGGIGDAVAAYAEEQAA